MVRPWQRHELQHAKPPVTDTKLTVRTTSRVASSGSTKAMIIQRSAGIFGPFPEDQYVEEERVGEICIRLDEDKISDESGVSDWKLAMIEVGLSSSCETRRIDSPPPCLTFEID